MSLGGVCGETTKRLTGGVVSPETTDRTGGEYAEGRGGLDTGYIGLESGGDRLRADGIEVDDARLAGGGDIGGDRGSEMGGELTERVMAVDDGAGELGGETTGGETGLERRGGV